MTSRGEWGQESHMVFRWHECNFGSDIFASFISEFLRIYCLFLHIWYSHSIPDFAISEAVSNGFNGLRTNEVFETGKWAKSNRENWKQFWISKTKKQKAPLEFRIFLSKSSSTSSSLQLFWVFFELSWFKIDNKLQNGQSRRQETFASAEIAGGSCILEEKVRKPKTIQNSFILEIPLFDLNSDVLFFVSPQVSESQSSFEWEASATAGKVFSLTGKKF